MTVRIVTPPITAPQPDDVVPLPSVVLDAKSLASGEMMLAGMPDAPPSLFVSQGSGSGGGVGNGRGTGIGDGVGPGLGSGSGGGFGGGVYHLGSGVTAPVLVAQPKPRYTADALQRHVQGIVVVEAVVGRDGVPYGLRVIRSLDAGLDFEAISALRNWRFLPGRLGREPVDVLVTIEIEFHMV
jgi:TonB family protein